MVLVTEHLGHGLVLGEPRIRDHIRARLHARALDAALAAGASPESTTGLALRAVRITRPATRDQLARSLERILIAALRPGGLRPTPLTRCRRQVVAEASDDLEALIARLRTPGPIAARGAAQVIILLSDGAGPLHLGTTEPDLRTATRQALACLDGPGTARCQTEK
jgi:hypothetical protein